MEQGDDEDDDEDTVDLSDKDQEDIVDDSSDSGTWDLFSLLLLFHLNFPSTKEKPWILFNWSIEVSYILSSYLDWCKFIVDAPPIA